MTSPLQAPRNKQLSAAVSEEEKSAAELAVRIDKLGTVSEALRTRTVTQLIERGRELLSHLEQMSQEEAVA